MRMAFSVILEKLYTMRKLLPILLFLFFSFAVAAQHKKYCDNPRAVIALLERIGGDGAAMRFETVVDESLATDGDDVFVITKKGTKPCIKGNSILSVTTGINWYLNHYAHINLTWNNMTTDLSKANLPLPSTEEWHFCNAKYRYNFNYCTFSYSTAFWTWERWQQEIDWMALHGINMPLQLVGLEVLWRNVLKDKRIGYSDSEVSEFIAGPGFMAWFAMNNLEGWGGSVVADDVKMNGNPEWWYERQEKLCRKMLTRMRELGMKPVLPGYCGMVPNSMTTKRIGGISCDDIIDSCTWAGGYTRPDIIKPRTGSFNRMAEIYYEHLEKLMGISEFYSMDPFHEGGVPVDRVSLFDCYIGVMESLDSYFHSLSRKKRKAAEFDKAKWIVQYWQGLPAQAAFEIMGADYAHRFIALDLFADAQGKAKWNSDYFSGCDYIFCMLHNFGGRTGMHGRLESTLVDYFNALVKGNGMCGVGATPEGIETNPILYDLLFELPWIDKDSIPDINEWIKDYTHARYGIKSDIATEAFIKLKETVWGCSTDQQGCSEAVILARPSWNVDRVSSWSTSHIYWDTQKLLQAVKKLISIKDSVTTADGVDNFCYDIIEVVRQALVDYAYYILPEIKRNKDCDNLTEYRRLYSLYLQLMLDLDELLSYDMSFRLDNRAAMARNIADEVETTTLNDRRWLEWNLRTQVTVWSGSESNLNDYSNRCWAGLIKDFHYARWRHFFENNGVAPNGGWYDSFEYPWTVDFTRYNYSSPVLPTDKSPIDKAVEIFNRYFGCFTTADGVTEYIFPLGIDCNTDVICNAEKGSSFVLPFSYASTGISYIWIDYDSNHLQCDSEIIFMDEHNAVNIPFDCSSGIKEAAIVLGNGVSVSFEMLVFDKIDEIRSVSVHSAGNGTVYIYGGDLAVTNSIPVRMSATPNSGYSFDCWIDEDGNRISEIADYIYYGRDSISLTAMFVVDKWGVPDEDMTDMKDIKEYAQYADKLSISIVNREDITIYEAHTHPERLFNRVSGAVDVARGASFSISWSDNDFDGLKYCCATLYADYNADGDFDDDGELLKCIGDRNSVNRELSDATARILLPYDAALGNTRLRLRFDGAWKDEAYNPENKSYASKATLNRMCYDITMNITEYSSDVSQIKVVTGNDAWGRVTVETHETPGDTESTEIMVTRAVPFTMRACPTANYEFVAWKDCYGRIISTDAVCTMYAPEDGTYTAVFRKRGE